MASMNPVSLEIFPSPPPKGEAPTARKLVLVAEDDPVLRHTTLRLVERFGVECVGASDGDQLLSWLEPLILHRDKGCSPDIVVTDIVMPGLGALDVVEGLVYAACHIPVIIMSGVQDPAIRARVDELGFPWVQKPVVPLDLEEQIRLALAASYARSTH